MYICIYVCVCIHIYIYIYMMMMMRRGAAGFQTGSGQTVCLQDSDIDFIHVEIFGVMQLDSLV